MNSLYFSENNSDWLQMPGWVSFLINFGYKWSNNSSKQRVVLISMPSDSAGAGLVSLGLLISQLGCEEKTDSSGYFDGVLRYSAQYLGSCKDCQLRCRPELKRCGYISEAKGRIHDLITRKIYQVSAGSSVEEKKLVLQNGVRWTIYSGQRANALRIEGRPQVRAIVENSSITPRFYQEFFKDVRLLPKNLLESYSGLCIAGKSFGASASRDLYSKIKFKHDDEIVGLDELLTIQKWSGINNISRMILFNTRTKSFDRHPLEIETVIADGIESFLTVFNQKEFQRSDLIGIINQAEHRDILERLGQKLSDVKRWYEIIRPPDFLDEIPIPLGMNMMQLQRKS